jgi:XTP/dITP diphosphohydrolase
MKSEYILFNTQNDYKFDEVKLLFKGKEIEIYRRKIHIEEIQSFDFDKVATQKILHAFSIFGRPVLVEHTGLFVEALDGMPGPLTQPFWDKLQGNKICKIVASLGNAKATAKTILKYCDGKRIRTFEGELAGEIAIEPRGNIEFQWGTIFIPKIWPEQSKTYSEFPINEINKYSHRARAFEKLISFLENS